LPNGQRGSCVDWKAEKSWQSARLIGRRTLGESVRVCSAFWALGRATLSSFGGRLELCCKEAQEWSAQFLVWLGDLARKGGSQNNRSSSLFSYLAPHNSPQAPSKWNKSQFLFFTFELLPNCDWKPLEVGHWRASARGKAKSQEPRGRKLGPQGWPTRPKRKSNGAHWCAVEAVLSWTGFAAQVAAGRSLIEKAAEQTRPKMEAEIGNLAFHLLSFLLCELPLGCLLLACLSGWPAKKSIGKQLT